jgi:predicted dehydrogenase
VIIGGTKKMLVFDDVKSIDKLTVYDSGIEVKTSDTYGDYEFKVRTGDIHIPYIPFEDSLLASLEHFADCVKNKRPSRSSPAQAVRVIEILERAQACLDLLDNQIKEEPRTQKKAENHAFSDYVTEFLSGQAI